MSKHRKVVSEFDTGPHDSVLTKLLTLSPHEQPDLNKYFGFSSAHKFKIHYLESLLHDFNLLPSPARQQLALPAIAQWIFTTNKIESAGLPHDETLQFILSQKSPQTRQEREVAFTMELLQAVGEPSKRDYSAGLFDPPRLKNWHVILSVGEDKMDELVIPSPGLFRKSGAYSQAIHELNEPAHIFPHHEVVPTLINKLGAVIHRLGHLIDNEKAEGHHLISYAFALAAFAQFHFVDIHPFVDGNGRMCRFISKYILDKVCPVPFPMFPVDKHIEYYKTLINGRKEQDPSLAPSLLMGLMLDSAIDYYKEILRKHGASKFSVFFCGTEIEQIEEQVRTAHLELCMKDLTTAFANLQPGTFQDISLEGHALRLMKMEDTSYISLDSL